MTSIAETIAPSQSEIGKPETEKRLFKVFIGFKKPKGMLSIFFEGGPGCGVYQSLGEIFRRPPREVYENVEALVWRSGNGFMQEYLSLDDASFAVARASLFADTSRCTCFLLQKAYFYIRETK